MSSWNVNHFLKVRELLPIRKRIIMDEALEGSFVGGSLRQEDVQLPANVSSTIAIATSCDGRTFATTHGDHTVKIFYFYSNTPYRVFDGHPRTPWTVKYHPTNPNIVASGCLGSQVSLSLLCFHRYCFIVESIGTSLGYRTKSLSLSNTIRLFNYFFIFPSSGRLFSDCFRIKIRIMELAEYTYSHNCLILFQKQWIFSKENYKEALSSRCSYSKYSCCSFSSKWRLSVGCGTRQTQTCQWISDLLQVRSLVFYRFNISPVSYSFH